MKNFKIILILTIVFMVGTLSIISCENEKKTELSNINQLLNVSNPKNPFDSLGISHNEMCISFIEEKENEIRYNLLNKYDVFEFFNTSKEVQAIVSNHYSMSQQTLKEFKSIKNSLYDEYPLLIEAYTIIRSEIVDTTKSLEQKINAFVKFENEILDGTNDYLFEEIEQDKIEGTKQAILASCAIGRNSLFLWSSKSEGGLGYYDFINTNTKTSAPPQWFVDDLWGAWTSALFTANPFIALAGGAASSAVSVLRSEFE